MKWGEGGSENAPFSTLWQTFYEEFGKYKSLSLLSKKGKAWKASLWSVSDKYNNKADFEFKGIKDEQGTL